MHRTGVRSMSTYDMVASMNESAAVKRPLFWQNSGGDYNENFDIKWISKNKW